MLVDMHPTEIHQNDHQAPMQVILRKENSRPQYSSRVSFDPQAVQPSNAVPPKASESSSRTELNHAASASSPASVNQNRFRPNGALNYAANSSHDIKNGHAVRYRWTPAEEEASDTDRADDFNTDHSGFSIDKFVQKLDSIQALASSKRCARSIRMALQSAGAVFGSHPVAASDWGDTLTQIGFKQIQPEFDHPQEGDIYIIRRTNKHVYGHIAGFSGSQWVSDFKQKSYDVYKEDGLKYEYYRLNF